MKPIASWIFRLVVALTLLVPVAHAQTASDYTQGVSVSGSTATIWFAPTGTTTSWVDIHYTLSNGAQENLRMTYNGVNGHYETAVSPVSSGDTLDYSFTYNKGTPAYNSAAYAYTVNGDTGGSGSNGGGSSGPQGVDVSGSTATIWFASPGSTTSWVDVHYTLNNGALQNLRMGYNSTKDHYETVVSPVSSGDTLSYSFTYNEGTPAYNSPTYAYTVNGDTGGSGSGGGGSGNWNGMTTFHIVNQTNGQWADNQVYWAIIGKDWNTGQFVHVDASGNLVPMSPADNGALVKDGIGYTNYFHTLAQLSTITIPPINSARIMFSVGSPMYMRVVTDVNGNLGYTGPNTDNSMDPNIDVYFDFGEFAIVPPGQDSPGININTTRVDQFGFPLKLHLQGLNGYDQTVGEPLTESRSQLFADFMASVPSQFVSLAQVQAPYRIVAPAHATFRPGQVNANYMQSYIDSVWNQFRSQDLIFTLQNMGTFHGHVFGNTFVFTGGNDNGTNYINGEPTTTEVMLDNGLCNDSSGAGNTDVQLQIQAQICAALNRHVAASPSLWYVQSAHYPAGTEANWYAKFWHDHSIDAKAYGFSYDDVGGFSPLLYDSAPTDVTYTIGW